MPGAVLAENFWGVAPGRCRLSSARKYNCTTMSVQGHRCLLIELKLERNLPVSMAKLGVGRKVGGGGPSRPQPRTAPDNCKEAMQYQ